ncbi:hypothetical protein Prudu_015512 [Prunus dulcis]|uniref:PRELI/MSF1 domain-containing protein n=2 Tax=Prunus TaxID=3754 RepID=A0A4Y1RJ77_PRUDU|nr:hypothetical protein Prudu_015512 [Prunus dulcis]
MVVANAKCYDTRNEIYTIEGEVISNWIAIRLVILEDPLMLFCKLYYCIASDAHAIQIYAYEVTNKVMVKAYTQEYTYKHPWERVTSASWKKFADPENKRTLSHILEVDTLNHKLDPSTGKLYTTRAITVHSPGPWFVRKIVRQDVCHCVESTVVDAKTRSMQLTTNNISLEKFIEVEEKIRYDPHPENPDGWTICRQETSIRIKPLSALASMAEKVEQRCAERFVQNSAKGREVMERICKYLEAESKGLARS